MLSFGVRKATVEMRKVLLILAPVLFLAFASAAFADTVNYTASSSIMGQSFTFTFSEPGTLSSLDTFVNVNFTGAGLTLTNLPAEVQFYSAADMGLFNLTVNIEGTDTFEFLGDQSYSGTGPFTLLTGNFPLSSAFGFGDLVIGDNVVAAMDGGTVTATSAPEPATLGLLASGLFGLAALRRKKLAA